MGRRRFAAAGSVAAAVALMLAACHAPSQGSPPPGQSPAPASSPHPDPASSLATGGQVTAPSDAPFTIDSPGVAVTDHTHASSLVVVVTKRRPLSPLDYVPADLVALEGVPVEGAPQMRRVAAEAYRQLWEGAAAAGVDFFVVSAYRSYEEQRAEFEGYVAQFGRASAERGSARPGHSEHQTGLAVDVNDAPAHLFTAAFGSTPAGQWLAAHAHEYGFIISYPAGKEAVTGYRWEPWHLRYVGAEVAQGMRAAGVSTLQEYLGVEASPTYP